MAFAPFVLAAAAVGKAVQTYQAGQEAAIEHKQQARLEQDAATQREIERRRELLRALASQNAAAGAAGVETGGSIGGIIRTDIKNNENDLLVSRMNSAAQYRARMRAASNAKKQGTIGAVTSLLDGGMQVYGVSK